MKKPSKTVNLFGNTVLNLSFLLFYNNGGVIQINIIEQLPDDARQVKGTLNWVDRQGNVYGVDTRIMPCKTEDNSVIKHPNYGKYFKYSTYTNSHNGYVYCTFKYIIDQKNNKFDCRQRRVHILVAETFLENPNNYPIVGHKNNIKSDNRVDNLYWTTNQENTQKAVDDKLLVNMKSYDDSQSKPVIMFDTYSNKEIGRYGSICEAARMTGLSKTTIARQAKYKKPVRKEYYFRFQDDECVKEPTIVIRYDLNTHEEIGRYWNTNEASRQTGVHAKTIASQCSNNKIPKYTKDNTYFLYSDTNI